MSTAEDVADANLIESVREHARWQTPCECVEENGLLLVAGANGLPVGYRNCAARVDPRIAPETAVARAKKFFGARGRGFSMLTRSRRDQDLESYLPAAGFIQRSDAPCMLVAAPLGICDPPPGIRIECFAEERHVHDAVTVNAEAYQAIRLPPQEVAFYFNRPAALLSDRVVGYVAYRGDEPVSTALTIMSGGGAGVYWVGTVNAAQRLGLAGICTRLATNAGFARGARVVTLQASRFGEPVYQRLGYETYDRMKWHSYPAPA